MKSSVVRRCVNIAGRRTSVSMEDAFWNALCEIARERRLAMKGVIGLINADRKQGNLSSAIRLFVLGVYQDRAAKRKQISAVIRFDATDYARLNVGLGEPA
jgi:predicted DNA-binding ribbon-helix-helix protein